MVTHWSGQILQPPPPPSNRFFGDPGVGNMFLGGNAKGGSTGAFDTFINTTLGGVGRFGICRIYASSGVFPWSDIDYHSARGRVCLVTWNLNANPSVENGYTSIANLSAGSRTALDAFATQAKARPKIPVYVCFQHEPERHIGSITTDDAAKQDFRAAKRSATNYLRAAGVTNFVHVDSCYTKQPFTTQYSGDWRWWHTDWKGTTTSGDKLTPDVRDFHITDTCTDIQGYDCYNWWGVTGHAGSAWQTFQTQFAPQRNPIVQIFPNTPVAVAEWACAEYDGDETHVTHNWSAANENLTKTWVHQALQTQLANNVVLSCWFNGTDTNMLTNPAPAANDGPWRQAQFEIELGQTTTKMPVLT